MNYGSALRRGGALDHHLPRTDEDRKRIRIVLKKAEKEHEKAMVGNSDGALTLTLGTDDVHAAYERMREQGVRFLCEPYRCPRGVGALLLDQDGNLILLLQESGER
jgi:predicted enzyme related to lactoylglutathione lyase